MIIVSGFLKVDPDQRTSYLEGCRHVVRAARATKGCVDFHISADLIEADRINIFEQWESTEAVETFRGSGPTDDQQTAIIDAKVLQHKIAGSISLT
ncbi:MAG: antibiotic biosynthesis monooxygenase [Acidimicrobiales bacterium]|nr:antibiotic biosynthesis monooxygenase [Acidimicrobiales bacterium]